MTKCRTKCNIEKDISHFLFSKGKRRYLTICNECRKNYSKLYRQQNMCGTVYVYTNKINGKQYVGQTWMYLKEYEKEKEQCKTTQTNN